MSAAGAPMAGRWRWDRDRYATRALRIGPVLLWSSRPARGDGVMLPRVFRVLMPGWQVSVERRLR